MPDREDISLRHHQRVRLYVTPQAWSVDLAEGEGVAWLWRAYFDSGGINVEQSKDAGATWSGQVVGNDAAWRCPPSLCVTPWDDVLLAYHNSSGAARIWRTTDLGATWVDVATLGGVVKRYPRLTRTAEALYLAAHDGNALRVWKSATWGASVTQVASLSGIPEQAVAFRADRSDFIHLIFENSSGALQHRNSRDGVTWTAATALAVDGRFPSLALGIDTGLLHSFDGSTPEARDLNSAYDEVRDTLTPAAATFQPGTLGALVDHRGIDWAAGYIGGAVVVRWSGDGGVSWAVP